LWKVLYTVSQKEKQQTDGNSIITEQIFKKFTLRSKFAVKGKKGKR